MHAKLADVMLVLKLESELRLLVLWWISGVLVLLQAAEAHCRS